MQQIRPRLSCGGQVDVNSGPGRLLSLMDVEAHYGQLAIPAPLHTAANRRLLASPRSMLTQDNISLTYPHSSWEGLSLPWALAASCEP